MLKSAIRKQEQARRNQLSTSEFEELNQLLLQQFKQIDFTNISIIHTFISIVEKREPNTFLLIDYLKKNHPSIKILVPKANFSTLMLTHHPYQAKELLKKNSFNILEPTDTNMHDGEIDMILIPLLGFDANGNRVGYGKGFYDRFLKEFPTAKRIGISLFGPVEIITDTHPQDILLDVCITPLKNYKF